MHHGKEGAAAADLVMLTLMSANWFITGLLSQPNQVYKQLRYYRSVSKDCPSLSFVAAFWIKIMQYICRI